MLTEPASDRVSTIHLPQPRHPLQCTGLGRANGSQEHSPRQVLQPKEEKIRHVEEEENYAATPIGSLFSSGETSTQKMENGKSRTSSQLSPDLSFSHHLGSLLGSLVFGPSSQVGDGACGLVGVGIHFSNVFIDHDE